MAGFRICESALHHTLITSKIKCENNSIKTENIKLKQDLESAEIRHKEFFNSKHRQILSQFKINIDKKYEEYFEQLKTENVNLKKHVESLEKQLTLAKKDVCKFHTVQMEPIDLSVPESKAISAYTRVPRNY